MSDRFKGGVAAFATRAGAAGVMALVLAGCMGPTYGTDKPATQQLLEDVTGVLALTPERKEPIAYNPRPELVRPASMQVLPAPQASASSNPAWPESPEQRLARIRAEATANQDNASYRSPVATSQSQTGFNPDTATPEQQRAEFNRRLAENRQGSTTTRRFLSEPPLEYRVPASSAPTDDVGEDEWKKERRLQQATGDRRGWRSLIPWL